MPSINITRTINGLEGTVADQSIRLVAQIPRHHGDIRGEYMGSQLHCYWNIESNFRTSDPSATLLGEYDSLPIVVRSQIHLTRSYALRGAEIDGMLGHVPVQARLKPVDAPAHGPRVIEIDGTFGTDGITLFATLDTGRRLAQLYGGIGNAQIAVEITAESITGEYAAAKPLFPLLVVPLLYFTSGGSDSITL